MLSSYRWVKVEINMKMDSGYFLLFHVFFALSFDGQAKRICSSEVGNYPTNDASTVKIGFFRLFMIAVSAELSARALTDG